MKCSEVSTSFPSRRSPSCKTASHRGKSRSGRWALSKTNFILEQKSQLFFWKQYSIIEILSHSGMWRLLASSLGPTLGNSLRKCGSEAAFEDGSHFPNPSSYLAGLICEYFQGAPRIPYKPVFLDGWSPGYVTFAEENQVIVIFPLTFNFNFLVVIVFAYLSIWVYYLCRRAQINVN